MTKSEQINELATALSKAQGEISGAAKDSVNPHFKSKYADLSSCWDACRKALTDNGLAVVQIPHTEGSLVSITTILTHTSGQFIEGTLTLQDQKCTPQSAGSTITYARRYALCAFVGIAPEDDDANEASRGPSRVAPTPRPEVSPDMLKRLFALQSNSEVEVAELKELMSVKFGVDSTRALNRQQYDEVCMILQNRPKPKETIEDLKESGVLKTGAEV